MQKTERPNSKYSNRSYKQKNEIIHHRKPANDNFYSALKTSLFHAKSIFTHSHWKVFQHSLEIYETAGYEVAIGGKNNIITARKIFHKLSKNKYSSAYEVQTDLDYIFQNTLIYF